MVNYNKKYNWFEVQQYYDDGHTVREVCSKFGMANRTVTQAVKRGDLKTRLKSEALKLSYKKSGGWGCITKEYHGSEEHKLASSRGGGYKPLAGKGKGSYYTSPDGAQVYLQSTYELLLASILDELAVYWIRPKPLLYKTNEKIKKYYPDFYLPKQALYLEPKNDYLLKKESEQIKIQEAQLYNNVRIILLSKDDIRKEYIASLI